MGTGSPTGAMGFNMLVSTWRSSEASTTVGPDVAVARGGALIGWTYAASIVSSAIVRRESVEAMP